MDAAACTAALAADGGNGSSSSESVAGVVSAPPAALKDAQLLDSWCLPQDREAAGWGALSAVECQARYRERQAAAEAAVRGGSGMLLFKHVHKVGAYAANVT